MKIFLAEKCPQLNTFCNVCVPDLHTNKQHTHYIQTLCVRMSACSCVCVCTHKIQSVIYHCAPAALKNVHPSHQFQTLTYLLHGAESFLRS